jgi:hypothetical protein
LHATARLRRDLRWRFLKVWSRAHAELTPSSRRCDSLRHRPIESDPALRAHAVIAQSGHKRVLLFGSNDKRRAYCFAGSCRLNSTLLHFGGALGVSTLTARSTLDGRAK